MRELGVDAPVVLYEAGEVGVVLVVQVETLVGLVAPERDGEKEVVVVHAPVAVQVELREILDELDPPLAEDAEAEIRRDLLVLGAHLEAVAPEED